MKPQNYPTQPQELWNHFFNITRCPRPSKKEDKMREYVISVAKDNGFEYKVDEVGNVVIYVPATKGYENKTPVIIQNHMDMVTDATPDRNINFETDPIEVYVEDGWLKADRTTLGSDNGIGCAAALATITDKTISHPPLELLFTMDEETGLHGAWGVQSDYFKGKNMINLDTEEWGSLYIGCAGGIDYHFDKQYELIDSSKTTFQLKIGGLVGGHSGIDIQRGRANAIKLATQVLTNAPTNFEIASVNAGKAHNIIPRDASFFINIDEKSASDWAKKIEEFKNLWKTYLVKADQNFSVTFEKVENQKKVLKENDKNALLQFLTLFPHGAHNYMEVDRELVAISNNMAIVRIFEGKCFVQASLRFFDRNEIVQIEDKMKALAQAFNFEVSKHGEYPSWKPSTENKLLDRVKNIYSEHFGSTAEVKAIHAGLECGILIDRIGKIDAVSFGPTIMGAHSPQERLEIKTVEPFWKLFTETLKSF